MHCEIARKNGARIVAPSVALDAITHQQSTASRTATWRCSRTGTTAGPSHPEQQLLQPERLETILAGVLDRQQEQSERRREHIGELNRRAAESEARLKRLYDAIEAGIADLNAPGLKDRINGLKAIRDQAKTDSERAHAMPQNSGSHAVTPPMLGGFAAPRASASGSKAAAIAATIYAQTQRVEVDTGVVRIMGSKSRLLQTLIGKTSVNSAPTQGLTGGQRGICYRGKAPNLSIG